MYKNASIGCVSTDCHLGKVWTDTTAVNGECPITAWDVITHTSNNVDRTPNIPESVTGTIIQWVFDKFGWDAQTRKTFVLCFFHHSFLPCNELSYSIGGSIVVVRDDFFIYFILFVLVLFVVVFVCLLCCVYLFFDVLLLCCCFCFLCYCFIM